MKLQDVLKDVDVLKIFGESDIDIIDVKADSSSITKGSLFICIKGDNFDGHDFVKKAFSFGALAIVCERRCDFPLTQVIVKDVRKAMSVIASNYYCHPDKRLDIIGITGTNGKTSTANFIYQILNKEKINCGLIGTLGIFYGEKFIEPVLTTPDPLDLFKYLKNMADDGISTVVMEISAHAIYYKKVYGISFFAMVFTNLTQDHLDFFSNFEEYKKTKISLFTDNKSDYIITNSDDETGLKISCKNGGALSYGLNNPSDIFAIDVSENVNGICFVLNLFDRIYEINLGLFGIFNVYNVMAAATVCCLLGVHPDKVAKDLNDIYPVSGRLEKIYDKDFSVYLDYAHTPDGLSKAITSIKKITSGNLICVFGCGGNRDKSKREIMGEISGKKADFTILTSDNPRFEDPLEIIYGIEKGVVKVGGNYIVIEDRKEAIKYAVNIAKKGDSLLIAGKGAEKYQEILGIKYLYNDKDSFNEILGE